MIPHDTLATDEARRFGTMNLLVGIAQFAAWVGLISLLHVEGSYYWKIPLTLLFCLMMQGVFSLMHECFHGLGHPSQRLNWLLGAVSGAIFGTCYTLYRVNHEAHHVRNRSRAEIAEYIYPDENAAKKIFLYYFAVCGGIWLGSFIAALLLPFVPYRYVSKLNRPATSMNGYSLSFSEFSERDWMLLRLESVMGVLLWLVAIVVLDWDWRILLALYAAFAFTWSSLQWVYHMRTPLHRIEGAYDLRCPHWVRLLFLNFNFNLTHHRHPNLRWQKVYAKVNLKETQPLWYRYVLVFQCPEPMPSDPSSIRKSYF